MKNARKTLFAAAIALASLTGTAVAKDTVATTVYAIDGSHTNVLASWNHLGFSNPSLNFGNVTGTIRFNAARPAQSHVDVRIPMSGMESFTAKFNEHLRSGDLLDTVKFPEARFTSTSVKPLGKNRYIVNGNLTLRGITKPVILNATLNGKGLHPMAKKEAIGFDATAAIKRSDFGLGYAIPAVSDRVNLRITTEALAQ